MEKIFNKKTAVWVAAACIIFKGWLSAVLELHPDESYYWLWSKFLGLSYYDHPPMVAYFIKATTLFCDSEFFVRLSGLIVAAALSVLLWFFAKKLFNEKIAAASVIIINTMPLMLAGALIITPDTPVFLFWSFALFVVAQSAAGNGEIKNGHWQRGFEPARKS